MLMTFIRLSLGGDDMRAVIAETVGGGKADPAASPCNQNSFPLKSFQETGLPPLTSTRAPVM